MKLVLLGTSAAQPTEKRGLSCTCLQRGGEIIMFDAGEGIQVSFLKSGLGWNKKMKIFVTHLHGDHCIGLLGLLQTMTLQHREQPIEIYGPRGIDEFISANIKLLNFGLSFPVMISIVDAGKVFETSDYSIFACNAEHAVPSFSYLFIEKNKAGKFNPQKAKDLGIPEGRLWNTLQNGKVVEVNGKQINPEQVLGPKRPGKKIGISGDTRPTKRLEEFFSNCDYLIFDSTFLDELKDKAAETFHSTAKQAAILAKNANVSNLILTHFSARYKDESLLLAEAKTIHDSVIAAHDLLEIEIK
ncbi:MAG: ribonuclease Z [Nitrosopumilaceae archaeon]|nr:ribonuclease Z [Nitrosopumilaceae archaeon]NIU00866.1 ribonuclease Z [Nitrosopumilaceae archaeon]NIU87319.1 ribonuclease Z [Nitrosopumilaceae archaeon]NIV65847.1 ribonuclease Z [Nitrosopumilaceae archaeon]NIX61468.1 ribonuclease Z [Nitrosopumilaceae archaeon]